MIFLGVDPGIETTGVAVVEKNGSTLTLVEYGVIRTHRSHSLSERLAQLEQDFSALISKYSTCSAAGVEELFFAKNVTSALTVAHARGIILFTLQRSGITIQEMKPTEVKMALTGNGRADKKEVQRMVQLQFGLSEVPTPDDAADAAAIALAVACAF